MTLVVTEKKIHGSITWKYSEVGNTSIKISLKDTSGTLLDFLSSFLPNNDPESTFACNILSTAGV